MFAKLRLSILSARLLARRCPPRHRSFPIRNRPRLAASAFALAHLRPVLLPLHPSRRRRKYSPSPIWSLPLALSECHLVCFVGQAVACRIKLAERLSYKSSPCCKVVLKSLAAYSRNFCSRTDGSANFPA